MSDPNFLILYVDNPTASAAFYAELLGRAAIETSPTFALFSLNANTMLGLWSEHTVEPKAQGRGGGGEIAFALESDSAVRKTHDDWRRRGLPVLQAPTELDFGFTFVAADPDGHRLRVFAPRQA
jgi:catechol 2,3-dioxygenase-like lactoylglutathione lyase family enzyme